jgi:alpha-L-fucosidase 2
MNISFRARLPLGVSTLPVLVMLLSMYGGICGDHAHAQAKTSSAPSFATSSFKGMTYLGLKDAQMVKTGWGQPGDNQTINGNPLSIGSVRFTRGLALHAPGEATFALDGRQKWLSFYAGIAGDMTQDGSVVLTLEVDGKKSYESPLFKSQQQPTYVALPISGARTLRFIIGDGGNGNSADHLVLANLRVSARDEKPAPDLKPLPQVNGATKRMALIADSSAATTLWYAKPAEAWISALPVGNGRLGAMVFGGPQFERLQLNDVTVWSGRPQPEADRKDAYKNLPELRRLVREGKYREAENFANANWNGPAPYDNSYQTLGDLNFEFQLPEGDISEYQRQLDIGQAVAATGFTSGGVTFKRETFSSAPAGVLVHHLTASKRSALNFSMRLSRIERAKTRFVAPDTLVMTGDSGGALHYEVRARVLTKGGRVSGADDSLTVGGASEATVLLSCATTFVLDYDKGYKGGDLSAAARALSKAAAKSYQELRSTHIEDYRRYFDRVKLDLGASNLTLPTDERLKAFRNDPGDLGFVSLFYNFGRYLLISSSRPDNPLPSNSQGIWGDGLNLPWKSDYKSNINYEMNYWAAEPSNLGEMHLPMLRMTQSLVKPGTKTAQAYFGPDTPGWVVGYTTNGWGWTSPGARLSWGIWWGGSGWMCQHLWEHFAFSRDLNYLRSVYPTMKGAAQFWMANLVEGTDGKLIVSPSTSPENSFVTDEGQSSTITEGATMERSIVWDLLDNTVQAARVLGTDPQFAAQAAAMRDRIRPLQIGKGGQLMEWNGDWDLNSRDPHHRHVSHLFALHPGHQITSDGTPDLAQAAKKSLQLRGDDGTGWSLAWKINFWARLRDGDHTLRLMANQLRSTQELGTVMADAGGTYPNLFDAHPPFQIDGNFGFVSGIDEILLQSHERYVDVAQPSQDRYFIDLLPALPSSWKSGSVSGLRARGGFEIAMKWRDGYLTEVRIKSAGGTLAKVRYRGQIRQIKLRKGQETRLNAKLEA